MQTRHKSGQHYLKFPARLSYIVLNPILVDNIYNHNELIQ